MAEFPVVELDRPDVLVAATHRFDLVVAAQAARNHGGGNGEPKQDDEDDDDEAEQHEALLWMPIPDPWSLFPGLHSMHQ